MQAYKPDSVPFRVLIIYLGARLPERSILLPSGLGGPPLAPVYLEFHRIEFT